jgi:hypothetical protein
VLLARDANAEMDIRLCVLRITARPNRPDVVTLIDRVSLRDAQGAEVRQRDGIAVSGRDREREPVCRHRARERHRAAGRRADAFSICADVDSSVLRAGIRIRPE